MKNIFVSYEIAKQLKEKGFNEVCFSLVDEKNRIHLLNISDSETLEFDQIIAKYNGEKCVPSPLYQKALDFLRKRNIVITPDVRIYDNMTFCHIKTLDNKIGFWSNNQDEPLEYYQSLNKAIKKALELI